MSQITQQAPQNTLSERSRQVKEQYQSIRAGNRLERIGSGSSIDQSLENDIKKFLESKNIKVKGQVTEDHLKLAQKKLGVGVDGIIGPETMRALDLSLRPDLPIGNNSSSIEFLLNKAQHEQAIFKTRKNRHVSLSAPDIKKMMSQYLNPETGQYKIGAISAIFESGNRGAGTISYTPGDYGGPSYGTHQLSKGNIQKFLDASGYTNQFTGMNPGTNRFDSQWKNLAETDTNFGQAQHAFILATHYQPQMNKLKANGIDFSNRVAAVKEMVFSTAVQYGPNTNVITRALEGKSLANMTDQQIISTVQQSKRANVNQDFRSSSRQVAQSVSKRINSEEQLLLAMSQSEQSVA